MAAEHLRDLGQRIRERREALDLTQEDVARRMPGKVTGARISLWERGKNRPHDDSLEELAKALETTAAALLMPEPDKSETPDLSRVAGQDGLADLMQLIREDMDERRAQRDEIIQRLDRLEQTLAAAISEQVDDAAQRLDASVAEARSVLRAASQAQQPAASKRAPKRTRAA